jgi:polyhydroxyalkanoate synthase
MQNHIMSSPELFAINLAKILEQYQLIINKLIDKQSNQNDIPSIRMNGLTAAMSEVMSKIFSDPEKLMSYQMNYMNNYISLLNNTMASFMGETHEALYQPTDKDYRFKDPAWRESVIYNFIKQSYLMTSEVMKKMVEEVVDIDRKTIVKAEFYMKQLIDALSPTNFILTNPIVLKETIESNGNNLVKGMEKMLHDIEKSKRLIDISTTDENAFELGVNIATTKGKIIYQNDLMQLIQYKSLTSENYEIPLLIIPPCINKYYILDLNEENSCIRWLLNQGYTVFIISWVNPGKELSGKNFENYILEGPIAALDAIEKSIGVKKVNLIGYCLGGTLLAVTLAYLRAINDHRINTASFIATLIDFKDSGELSVFIDDDQLDHLEKQMEEDGFLDGSYMFETFNLLRANDMIWSCFINNYLLGKDPIPFDLLYWNSDSARLPAKMHSFYLRNMYQHNKLITPAAITINGIEIDLAKIDNDCYFLSCKEDHITPWKSTFAALKHFKGNVQFTLSGSGHVGGVINLPTKNKYGYWINDEDMSNPDGWLDKSINYQGSWWSHWDNWCKIRSGKLIKAIDPKKGKLKAIEDAPGSYVKMK